MPIVFSFKGEIGRSSYAAQSLATFFSQHLVTVAVFSIERQHLDTGLGFWVVPLRSLISLNKVSPLLFAAALIFLIVVAWALTALALRRATSADSNAWIAALAMAPFVQVIVIAYLSLTPSRKIESSITGNNHAEPARLKWIVAARGMAVGMVMTLLAVALGALFFGVYGFGMFVFSPFAIGAMTAFFANRDGDIGRAQTSKIVVAASALGAAALVGVALEGVVCIFLASPLVLFVALIGGYFGRSIALRARRSKAQALSSVALLPIVFVLETILAPMTEFETSQSIEVDAPPAVVWRSVIHMDEIDEPLALYSRLGVAYPVRGEVIGEGVGAERHGHFSTGTAIERVTEWVPGRKLAFTVISDVPAMRELSPYPHVHAPHVNGYFKTTLTSFELVPAGDSRTEIIERTSHILRLDPVLYWLPMVRWVVRQNNQRVLTHLKHQAERDATPAATITRSPAPPAPAR